jgi:hypothetical protein
MRYDPRLCTFVVNGRQITMWLKLEDGRENDRANGFDTADGQGYFGINPATRGYFNLTLAAVNPHSGYLENLSESDSPFPVVLIDRSDSKRSARGSQCMVKRVAPEARAGGDEKQEEQWDFVALDYTFGSAGAPADDVTSMVTGA